MEGGRGLCSGGDKSWPTEQSRKDNTVAEESLDCSIIIILDARFRFLMRVRPLICQYHFSSQYADFSLLVCVVSLLHAGLSCDRGEYGTIRLGINDVVREQCLANHRT